MLDLLRAGKRKVEALLERARARQRVIALEQHAPHVDGASITAGLRALGLAPGDTVMMHSSLKSLGFVEGGPRAVLEAVYAALQPGGTLVVPTYYLPGGTIYNTCRMADYVFDPRRHGSNLGALPAAFLTLPGVERSIHPTHSVSALGPRAHEVVGGHHRAPSVFGPGSPWARCLDMNAKVLGLGISMGPVTFYHLLEDNWDDRFPLPVRMAQTYHLPCRDWQGARVEVPVRPLDPQFMPRRIDHPSRGDLREFLADDFRRAGILHEGEVGSARAWYVHAQEFYQRLEALAGAGITIYATPGELAAHRA